MREHAEACRALYCRYANPALLVKEVTTLDHVSGGRGQLAIGAGWFRQFPAIGRRRPG